MFGQEFIKPDLLIETRFQSLKERINNFFVRVKSKLAGDSYRENEEAAELLRLVEGLDEVMWLIDDQSAPNERSVRPNYIADTRKQFEILYREIHDTQPDNQVLIDFLESLDHYIDEVADFLALYYRH